MKVRRRNQLPLEPLVHAYLSPGLPSRTQLGQIPGLGDRIQAILSAPRELLYETFLNQAETARWQKALVAFYTATVYPPLHEEFLRTRAEMVRHALGYLLRGRDPWPRKFAACLSAEGAYHVPGLGPSFWSALIQALNPSRHPAWTPTVLEGMQRVGLITRLVPKRPEQIYTTLLELQGQLQQRWPALSALHGEHFFSLVAEMQDRELWAGAHRLRPGSPHLDLSATLHQMRASQPLRERLRQRGAELAQAQRWLEEGLRTQNGKLLGQALALADPEGSSRASVSWKRDAEALTLWLGRLWEAEHPEEVLDTLWRDQPLPGAGQWLAAAVLHLRDPQHYPPWNETMRAAQAVLDESVAWIDSSLQRYRLLTRAAHYLREHLSLHPLETPAFLAALTHDSEPSHGLLRTPEALAASTRFRGFCADTFRFLRELEANNNPAWMEQQRPRYRFAVHAPLLELCQALTERYVDPVLRGEHGWNLATRPRKGLALTSICKNHFGRSSPYQTTLWITFCDRVPGGKRSELQLVVRLNAAGLCYGVRIGPGARTEHQRLQEHLAADPTSLFAALHERGAFHTCRAYAEEEAVPLETPEDLRQWATGGDLLLARTLSREDPLVRSDALVGDILLTLDRLLPLFALLKEEQTPVPPRRAAPRRYTATDFHAATFLDEGWLAQARSLLELKRQLILQGVPGTGKTHVARCLGRWLTNDEPEKCRLVQFHPAYSYEEFIEGIKVRSVEIEGRHEVTYPVEDGLLYTFATQAAACPGRPHVLIIDEINRGNLPRIFGELLYLLEYRDQEVPLPCSRRPFRLPANLYVIGTMNAADRSVVRLDQALRRRFSFLEMTPNGAVLGAWLEQHLPRNGTGFATRVHYLFERLNEQLRTTLGPGYQVGHSYFMVEDLDERRLETLWNHQIQPLLDEFAALVPGRLLARELAEYLPEGRTPPRRRSRASSSV